MDRFTLQMQYSKTGKACPVEGENAEHATDRPYADLLANVLTSRELLLTRMELSKLPSGKQNRETHDI